MCYCLQRNKERRSYFLILAIECDVSQGSVLGPYCSPNTLLEWRNWFNNMASALTCTRMIRRFTVDANQVKLLLCSTKCLNAWTKSVTGWFQIVFSWTNQKQKWCGWVQAAGRTICPLRPSGLARVRSRLLSMSVIWVYILIGIPRWILTSALLYPPALGFYGS